MILNRNERGIVSLVSTTIISLLLVIITVAMVYIMTSLSHQATNSDLSARAYYAAESAVEDEIWQVTQAIISAGPLGSVTTISTAINAIGNTNSVCPATVPVGSGSGQTYVCRSVSFDTQTVTDQAAADEANQYQIPTGKNLASVKISWNLGSQDAALSPGFTGFGTNPWVAPAVMELLSVDYPSANFASSDPVLSTYIIPPSTSVAASSSGSARIIPASSCTPTTTPASPYNCSVTISGFNAARNYIFRLRPRYTGTHFQLQFLDGSSNPIPVTDSKATIDVTAQAGNVLRRVQTKVKVRAGVLSGLDYGLYSDTNLCKTFTVVSNQATSGAICP